MKTMITEDLASLKRDVLALRDEVKLKIHLGSMDLKTELAKLEPEADKAWNEVTTSSIDAARELKRRFVALREQLNKH